MVIIEPIKSEINNNKPIHEPPSLKQKTILIIVPLGIPGMGKSYFLEKELQPYFEAQGYGF